MLGVSEVAWIRVLVEVKVVRVFLVEVVVVLRRLGVRCIGVVNQVPAAVEGKPSPTEVGRQAKRCDRAAT